MIAYVVSPEADEEIFEIWGHLFRNAGLAVANIVEAKLYNAFENLAQTPRRGHKRSDLTSHPVLFFAVYSYLVVYRLSTPLEIARVLHGRRDLKRILEQR